MFTRIIDQAPARDLAVRATPAAGSLGHLVIIIQNLPLRLDRRVRNECAAALAAGYQVSVICPKADPTDPDLHTDNGVTVHSYQPPPDGEGLASYVREFIVAWLHTARLSLRVNRARRIDVLQACNPPDTYWLLGLLWKLRGRRYLYDQHDLCPEVYQARFGRRGLLHRALLGLERLSYLTADRVISPNPAYRTVALERGRVDPDRTAVVMSTPDAELMRAGEPDPELCHGPDHLVCYVGIMGPQDGVASLVDSIEAFVFDLDRRDTHFALLGFGECLDELQAACTERGLDEWVTFTGRVEHEEISRWLSSAHVGVTPDPLTPFNDCSTMNKTLEYMAHGVPVVATDLKETRRCAGGAAVYVSGDDPVESAQAISDLLDAPGLRLQMGLIGRYRIEHDLSWDDQARNYVATLDALMGSGSPAGSDSDRKLQLASLP